jgi:hypothetical protein
VLWDLVLYVFEFPLTLTASVQLDIAEEIRASDGKCQTMEKLVLLFALGENGARVVLDRTGQYMYMYILTEHGARTTKREERRGRGQWQVASGKWQNKNERGVYLYEGPTKEKYITRL